MTEEKMQMPEVVTFKANGTADCKAYIAFGTLGLNMRSVQINYFNEKPIVSIEYVGGFSRVSIKRNADDKNPIWFDTDDISAAKIEQLVETGKAPK